MSYRASDAQCGILPCNRVVQTLLTTWLKVEHAVLTACGVYGQSLACPAATVVCNLLQIAAFSSMLGLHCVHQSPRHFKSGLRILHVDLMSNSHLVIRVAAYQTTAMQLFSITHAKCRHQRSSSGCGTTVKSQCCQPEPRLAHLRLCDTDFCCWGTIFTERMPAYPSISPSSAN